MGEKFDFLTNQIFHMPKSLFDKFTIRQYMLFFLLALILEGAFFEGFGAKALLPVILAVISTTLIDFGIAVIAKKLKEKNRIPNSIFLRNVFSLESAIISGLFIGGLLSQDLKWHIYILAGIVASLSKHLIMLNKRHIFNPAIIAVLCVSLVFGAGHSWWISSSLPLVLVFGAFIIWKMRRLEMAIIFLLCSFAAMSLIEILKGNGFYDIYYMLKNANVIYFFSMFMLTEPKTSPFGKRQKIVYGIFVALIFIGLHFLIPLHDLLIALAMGNVLAAYFNGAFKFEKNSLQAL